MKKLLSFLKKKSHGFTLIEILLVLSIIAIITAVALPVSQTIFTKNNLDVTVNNIESDLNKAYTFARAGKNDSDWGIHLENNTLTFFADSYDPNNANGLNEIFVIQPSITLGGSILNSGVIEVVFAKGSGIPNIPNLNDTITAAIQGVTKTIYINSKGQIGLISSVTEVHVFSPSDISGLQLRLDAGEGVIKDMDEKVSVWADQSGSGNDASQVSMSNQPLWVDNQINSHSVISFDGVNSYLEFPEHFLYNYTNLTLFIVNKPKNLGDNCAILGPSGTNSTGLELLFMTVNHHLRINGLVKYYTGLFTSNVFTVSEFTYNGSNTIGYNNGVALSAMPGGDALNYDGIYALGRYSGPYNAKSDVAEILIYDSTLSDTDRQAVESYLNTKYDIYE